MDGVLLASLAGMFAAAASMLIKLGLSKDMIKDAACGNDVLSGDLCANVSYFICGFAIVLGILCNGAMWLIFSKGLAKCESTVKATTASTFTNFLLTGVFGAAIFGEPLSLLWGFGIFLIVIGLHFLNKGGYPVKDD